MARVMPFYAPWKQTFAATLSAACQGCATPFCFHTGTKTMLTFACSLGWLVSTFHKPKTDSARFKSGYSKVERNIVNATKRINS
jgi:hypothetical protein